MKIQVNTLQTTFQSSIRGWIFGQLFKEPYIYRSGYLVNFSEPYRQGWIFGQIFKEPPWSRYLDNFLEQQMGLLYNICSCFKGAEITEGSSKESFWWQCKMLHLDFCGGRWLRNVLNGSKVNPALRIFSLHHSCFFFGPQTMLWKNLLLRDIKNIWGRSWQMIFDNDDHLRWKLSTRSVQPPFVCIHFTPPYPCCSGSISSSLSSPSFLNPNTCFCRHPSRCLWTSPAPNFWTSNHTLDRPQSLF